MRAAAARTRHAGLDRHPPVDADEADEREQGVTVVEFALVAWLLMVLVLGALQFGLWWNAQHVVLGAAQDAARMAAVEDGTIQAGRARALELLRVGLGQDANSATVTVHRGPQTTQATITARLQPLLPVGGIRLHATASVVTERFRASASTATPPAQPPATTLAPPGAASSDGAAP
jgi:hypothetical protein